MHGLNEQMDTNKYTHRICLTQMGVYSHIFQLKKQQKMPFSISSIEL